VPVALFVGLQDTWSDPTDVHLFKDWIPTLKFYKEYNNQDHYSFTTGKVMPHVTDAITFLKQLGDAPEVETPFSEETPAELRQQDEQKFLSLY